MVDARVYHLNRSRRRYCACFFRSVFISDSFSVKQSGKKFITNLRRPSQSHRVESPASGVEAILAPKLADVHLLRLHDMTVLVISFGCPLRNIADHVGTIYCIERHRGKCLFIISIYHVCLFHQLLIFFILSYAHVLYWSQLMKSIKLLTDEKRLSRAQHFRFLEWNQLFINRSSVYL